MMQTVDYATEPKDADAASVAGESQRGESALPPSPIKKPSRKRKNKTGSESDTDFQAESEDESEPEPAHDNVDAEKELGNARRRSTTNIANSSLYKQNGAGALQVSSSKSPAFTVPVQTTPKKGGVRAVRLPLQLVNVVPPKGGSRVRFEPRMHLSSDGHAPPTASSGQTSTHRAPLTFIDLSTPPPESAPQVPRTNAVTVKPFERATIPIRNPLEPTYGSFGNRICPACHKNHPQGACELKAAGVEHCNLCGLAHFGYSRTCPHIKSETQVRAMLEALKNSPEKKELVDTAMKYLRGVKGTLVQQKKRDREKAALAKGQPVPPPTYNGIGRPPKNASTRPPGSINGTINGAASGSDPSGPSAPVGLSHDPSRSYAPFVPQAQMQVPPGSVNNSALQHQQRMVAQQQMVQQMQGQGFDDQQVESALRGFLFQS
jgi:hypothetical protein